MSSSRQHDRSKISYTNCEFHFLEGGKRCRMEGSYSVAQELKGHEVREFLLCSDHLGIILKKYKFKALNDGGGVAI